VLIHSTINTSNSLILEPKSIQLPVIIKLKINQQQNNSVMVTLVEAKLYNDGIFN